MKSRLKHLLKFGILTLGISLLLTNCQKDDEQLHNNIEVNTKKSIKITTLYKTDIEKKQNLLRSINSLQSTLDAKNRSLKNNRDVYNLEYDFTINTDYARHIDNGVKETYTFPIFRTQDNGLLENLLLVLQEDSTFMAYIVQYELTEEEITAINFLQPVDMANKITFIEINNNELSDDIFGKYYYNGNCYEDNYVYQSATNCPTPGVNHTYQEGSACIYWGTINTATSGGYVNIPILVSCDGVGYGNPNNPNNTSTGPNGNTNNHGGQAGTGTPTSTITCRGDCDIPDPDLAEEDCIDGSTSDLVTQMDSVFGTGNHEFDCNMDATSLPSFNSVVEVEAYLDSLLNNNFTNQSSEMDDDILSSLRDDMHVMPISDFPEASLLAKIRVRVPDDNNSQECLEIISTRVTLDGDETLFNWTQLDTTDATDEINGPLIQVNEADDRIRIEIQGELRVGLSFMGLPNRGVKTVVVKIVYSYSTGELLIPYSYIQFIN